MASATLLHSQPSVQLSLPIHHADFPIRLVALLCNPPTNKSAEDTITWKNLKILGGLFGLTSIKIVNLVPRATKSTDDLYPFAGSVDYDALAARTQRAVTGAIVVAAWGTGPPSGWPRNDWRKIVAAAMSGVEAAGQLQLAHIGPKTRHPSRWRQFTSPVHNRFLGTTFELRLAEALQWSSPAGLLNSC